MTQDPSTALDEVDRRIVHAMQIHPRAPWRLVGEVLAIDPVTAARRWQRMERDRLAWITAYPRLADPRNAVTAVVEIDTRAGAGPQVAETIAAQPRALNVKETAGGRDLVVSAQAPTLDELARFISLHLATVPGVTATRTHVVTAMPTEGSSWRLRDLDAGQRFQLERAAVSTPGPVRDAAWDAVDGRMLSLLSTDGRMPIRRLADELGTSVTTAGRRLRQLVGSRISLRCDVARPVSGWPLSAVYFASAPADKLREISQALAAVSEVRSCAITAGPHNLVIDVWLRSLPDVHNLEAHLCARLPLRVADRAVVLRTVKHMGRLLDPDGRCRGVVPLDWSIT
ncbi:Lrp/AsnC family transcriptional regulator [Pseudonocardia sp. DSM 110487]|uniref:Lrp/AsnC family transcriptional regulator n=1 Tax=Pseudonocardia sp. DSM 110487 TaxID=2865833 RepID=UPI001C69CAF1|nr:Lrp/AsnC family transcriptional regulator [Pseudonocardia sp. DSM 110487]QYN38498.1 Lrp/AsnC family transcriptional regulator [Pseudonocardia sp. DSM 110487]